MSGLLKRRVGLKSSMGRNAVKPPLGLLTQRWSSWRGCQTPRQPLKVGKASPRVLDTIAPWEAL
jgi:hypothetical protein